MFLDVLTIFFAEIQIFSMVAVDADLYLIYTNWPQSCR